jgi:hypothetical protein
VLAVSKIWAVALDTSSVLVASNPNPNAPSDGSQSLWFEGGKERGKRKRERETGERAGRR